MMAGIVATGILIYLAYKVFLWKSAKMGAERRAPQGEERVVWGNLGRIDQEDRVGVCRFARRPHTSLMPPRPAAVLPPPAHEDICADCREEAAYNVLRGHFQPPAAHPV